MADRVAVVTDSTAYLPPGTAEALGIRVVRLRIQIGSRTATDGVDITPAEVTAALRQKLPISTSRPTPAEFARVFRDCLADGAKHVVAVQLASALSGTWESAVLASQDFDHGVVRVVDSRGTAMGLGFAVMAAAECAQSGGSAAEVQGAATAVVDNTKTLFYVDTIEYLRRGGRVGAAAALLATSLSVKPLLQMVEGQISALEKVRTSAKAISRLIQLTVAASGPGPVDIAVHHVAAATRADQVADQLRSDVPGLGGLYVSELGPVLSVHLGPGAIGTVVVRR